MLDLAKYSFVNSKIRAMLSCLLSPGELSHLVEARDVHEMLDVLKSTAYRQIVEGLHSGNIELENIEKEFIKEDLHIYRKVHKMFSTNEEKNFIAQLMECFEIEELKVILRAWHKKIPIDLNDYILNDKINYEIDFKKIISAQNFDEIMFLLDHTPYESALLSAKKKFQEHNSTFYLEAALDSDYYQRLFAVSGKFSPSDKIMARKLLGIEIDIENINSLIRFRKYYSLSADIVMDLFIPGGDSLAKDKAEKIYDTGNLAGLFRGIAQDAGVKFENLNEQNAYFIENFLYEILLHQVKLALSGFPFTIGVSMGYLILKRRETRNIVSLFYSKALGIKKDEVSALLNI